MRIAIIGAGFTPEEADGLRRAMATFRRVGTLPRYRRRFLERLVERGCAPGFAEQCWRQIEGFGEYGFPESHAASFAILVYASAWLKCRYPEVFACALLNSQPMGFYAPARIVRDARAHGVEVRPADVNASEWDCTLEPAAGGGGYALRLGFRLVKGLGEEAVRRLTAARGNGYREPGPSSQRGPPPLPLARLPLRRGGAVGPIPGHAARSTSNAARLRASLLNSTAMRWIGWPRCRYLSA